MNKLKTNEEFAQEVIRRGEVYKRKRRRMIMSVSAGLVVVFACAAVFVANGGYGGLTSSDEINGNDLAGGQYEGAEYDGDLHAPSGGEKADQDTSGSFISPENHETASDTETDFMPFAEIYFYTEENTCFASVDLGKVSQLIEQAKQLGEVSEQSRPTQAEGLDNAYQICITGEALEVYYLRGSELYDQSADVTYILSDTDADALREDLDRVMKER